MTATTPRPPSPWPGSRHETEHRWQLDGVRTLAEAAGALRSLAAELRAAHAAGWALAGHMTDGHLLATRPSRRRRAQQVVGPPPTPEGGRWAVPSWRLRVVDEAPVPGEEALHLDVAVRTPVVAWSGAGLQQVSGPAVSPDLLLELGRQVTAAEVGHRRWGVAPARVGPNADLVADGSALRIHAVEGGALVRTLEALTFRHAADGAPSLLDAAAAYERAARTAELMTTAGGRLLGVDDGLLGVGYARG
ncbi:hypothetical protein GCU56_08455 [Geodermatophilus sabuli]|uniref:Uncharacterized protein n=1 Tax=Geodermatophilus sabuli TaxID=1564158 RepID=A0A7K3VZS8_9ACTN|nr:hypothetical protein [Geodermatophilus sabuli]NEK57900.1 hypothetical protein [Geodermatophilus sabuli]